MPMFATLAEGKGWESLAHYARDLNRRYGLSIPGGGGGGRPNGSWDGFSLIAPASPPCAGRRKAAR
jgi:hypothetical protein